MPDEFQTTIRAHKKNGRVIYWVLDRNCEIMLEPQVGDFWEIKLIRKIDKNELLSLQKKKIG